VDVEVHDLHAVPVGVVTPAKANPALGEGDDPAEPEALAAPHVRV
jgi:hypothetical protein